MQTNKQIYAKYRRAVIRCLGILSGFVWQSIFDTFDQEEAERMIEKYNIQEMGDTLYSVLCDGLMDKSFTIRLHTLLVLRHLYTQILDFPRISKSEDIGHLIDLGKSKHPSIVGKELMAEVVSLTEHEASLGQVWTRNMAEITSLRNHKAQRYWLKKREEWYANRNAYQVFDWYRKAEKDHNLTYIIRLNTQEVQRYLRDDLTFTSTEPENPDEEHEDAVRITEKELERYQKNYYRVMNLSEYGDDENEWTDDDDDDEFENYDRIRNLVNMINEWTDNDDDEFEV